MCGTDNDDSYFTRRVYLGTVFVLMQIIISQAHVPRLEVGRRYRLIALFAVHVVSQSSLPCTQHLLAGTDIHC